MAFIVGIRIDDVALRTAPPRSDGECNHQLC